MTDHELLIKTGKALDNLLSLWIRDHGYDWNCVDAALDALAHIRKQIPDFPVTAAYSKEVDRRVRIPVYVKPGKVEFVSDRVVTDET